MFTLQLRHNERDGVSSHQYHDCLLNRYSGTDERKHQSSAINGLCAGIHRSPVNSPYKGPRMRKMFPFDDIIMFCVLHMFSIYTPRHFLYAPIMLAATVTAFNRRRTMTSNRCTKNHVKYCIRCVTAKKQNEKYVQFRDMRLIDALVVKPLKAYHGVLEQDQRFRCHWPGIGLILARCWHIMSHGLLYNVLSLFSALKSRITTEANLFISTTRDWAGLMICCQGMERYWPWEGQWNVWATKT